MAVVAALYDADHDDGGDNNHNGGGSWNDQIQIHQHGQQRIFLF